jgi:hypothetical protein
MLPPLFLRLGRLAVTDAPESRGSASTTMGGDGSKRARTADDRVGAPEWPPLADQVLQLLAFTDEVAEELARRAAAEPAAPDADDGEYSVTEMSEVEDEDDEDAASAAVAEAKARRAAAAVAARVAAERAAQRAYDEAIARVEAVRERIERAVAVGELEDAEAAVLRLRLESARAALDAALASRMRSSAGTVLTSLRRALGALREVGEEAAEDEEAAEPGADDEATAGFEDEEADYDDDPSGEAADAADAADMTLDDALEEAARQASPQRGGDMSDVDDEPVYSVDALLNRYAKLVNGVRTTFYRVQWTGFGRSHTSWEPESNIGRAAIDEYERANGPLGANHGVLKIHFYRAAQGYRVSVEATKAMRGATPARVWLEHAEFVDSNVVDAFDQSRARAAPNRGRRRPSAAGAQERREADDSGSEGEAADAAEAADDIADEAGEEDRGRGGGGGPDDDDSDDDDDEPDGGGGGGGGPAARGASPLARLLTWDANRSEIRVSITKTLRDGAFRADSRALWEGLWEFTVTRLFLLEAVTPPGDLIADDALLRRVATSYYAIEEAAFKSDFKATVGGPTYAQHKANEIAYQARRARRRWTEVRAACDAERRTLRSYLAALRRIRSEADAAAPTPDARGDELQNRIVREYRARRRWWTGMHEPRARSTTQNALMRYRSAETKRFLSFVRRQWYPRVRRTDAARRGDTLGSPFSGKIPTSAQEPSVTVLDHTTPQLWFENSELVDVFAQAREDVVNTLPVPASENSKKGAAPIRFLAPDPDDPNRPDHALFAPDADYFSEARHAVCARRVLYAFLAYGLVTEQHDAHSSLRQQGPGCAYYARPRVRDHLLRVVRDHPAAEHERFANVMTLFVFRTWNPLVANPKLLAEGEFADDYRQLLRARLEGTTRLPQLCGDAMRAAVAGFPD